MAGGRRKSAGRRKKGRAEEALPANEVDEFMEARDRIEVSGGRGDEAAAGGRRGRRRAPPAAASSDSDEADMDPTRGSANVLDLQGVDSSDSSDSDEYADGADQAAELAREDEEERFRTKRAREVEEEEAMSKQWGKSKGAYYNADTAEFEVESDEDVAKDEEAEAMRLQRERAEQLDDDDFEEADMLGAILASREDGKAKKKKEKKQKKKKQKKKQKKRQDSSDSESDEEDEDGGASRFSLAQGRDSAVERVAKDLSKLTKDDKLQVVLTDSPELLGLLEDLRANLDELRTSVAPLLRRVAEGKVSTGAGISFLEMKYQVLLNYCVNIVFYLYLKSEGASVKDHPVVRQLVYYRTVLEKIKPLDQKLKYQVDKLLQSAASAAAAGSAAPADAAPADTDALSFRPNPKALVAKEGSGAAAAGGADEGRRAAKGGDADGDDGVYRPPRLSAVPYMDKAERRQKRDDERKRRKLAGSTLVRELRAELSERPAEETALGLADARPDEDMEQQRLYEEENFLRLADTKKQKKKRSKGVSVGIFDDLEDFGDLGRLAEANDDEAFGLGELRAARAAAEAEAEMAEGRGGRKRKAGRGRRGGADVDLDEDALYGEEADRASAMYDSMESSRRKKRKAREEMYKAPENTLAEHDPYMLEDEESRREVGRDIMKNRGLTRHRPRDKSNPKTRNRHKYEKALTKRKSQVQDYKGHEHQYGGEKTGFKSNLVRSTSLQN